MRRLLATTALVATLWGGSAQAHISFFDAPGNYGNEVNVLFQAKEIGTNIVGQVGHTSAGVLFDTLTNQDLDQTAQGNADIFCLPTAGFGACPSAGGGLTDLLTSMEMKAGLLFGQKTAWTDVILNMQNGTGSALVTVTDQFGASFTDPLAKGQNFLAIVATLGEVITDIQITNADTSANPVLMGFEEFKQPRVSGLCVLQGATCQAVDTPEPGTLALLTFGLLGTVAAARRRRS